MSDTRGELISVDPYEIKDQISQMVTSGIIRMIEDVNRFTYISEIMRKTVYKDHVSFYLRYNSQYRHMWE